MCPRPTTCIKKHVNILDLSYFCCTAHNPLTRYLNIYIDKTLLLYVIKHVCSVNKYDIGSHIAISV